MMKSIEQKHMDTITAFIKNPSNENILNQTNQFFTNQLIEAFVDRTYEVVETFTKGEKVIARILITGTHRGMFAGNTATDKTVKITQFREFHVVDGEIINQHGWFDTGTLLPQIKIEYLLNSKQSKSI
ncbi:ester cyclase [Shimazuella kribbensis]|uniref:ester cyclase n=1 Tax=Shimazuella kribbensis TaxID=139808 RepID=UPI0004191F33|nr:ester cyclase [Shimazuella kribbensis]